ncbi:MAG TPA: hypothetical protein VH593_08315, partial [Ktedonobacteraceae bacterium]
MEQDLVRALLQDAERIPRLSASDERRLGTIIQTLKARENRTPREDAMLLQAVQKFASANVRLVVSKAGRYAATKRGSKVRI